MTYLYGNSSGPGTTIAAGTIHHFGGASLPTGYLWCDGTSYLRATYPDLFTAIGTSFGSVDGTHFSVPDLRDAYPKGKGGGDSLGTTGGALTHTHDAGTLAAGATSAGTPAGTVSQPTFTGSALAGHQHGTGTYAVGSTDVGTPAGTVAWPVGVPTFTGSAGATGAANAGATSRGATASTITIGTHTHTFTPAGTVAWPVGVPTFAGTGLGSHTHTLSGSTDSISGGTPAGTVSQPTFTGSALGTHTHTVSGTSTAASSEPPFVIVNFIIKT